MVVVHNGAVQLLNQQPGGLPMWWGAAARAGAACVCYTVSAGMHHQPQRVCCSTWPAKHGPRACGPRPNGPRQHRNNSGMRSLAATAAPVNVRR